MHSMDHLDVGETVQWGLSINDYLEDFIGKGVSGNFASAEIGSFSFGRNRQD